MPVDHVLDHPAPNVAADELATRMVALTDAACVAVDRAASRAAHCANQHCRELFFGMGEQVLLSTRTLKLLDSPKFRQRFVGPFEALSKVGTVSYRLKLTGRL